MKHCSNRWGNIENNTEIGDPEIPIRMLGDL